MEQPVRNGDYIELSGEQLTYLEASELCMELIQCLTQGQSFKAFNVADMTLKLQKGEHGPDKL